MLSRDSLRSLRAALAVFAILFLVPGATLRAQQPAGTVEGSASAGQGGAPLPLSLVQLLPGGGSDEPLRGTLTDAAGAFRFEGVAPGRYRLRLDRVGYEAAPGEPFAVAAGETVRRRVAVDLVPVVLEGLTVSGNACYGLDRLDDAPDLAALWREAQKAVETRRRFQQQYRFTFDRRVNGEARLRFLRNRRIVQDTTIVSDPDSAIARQARRRGFGQQGRTSFLLRLPDELELLNDDFLRTHCLEGDTEGADGGLALRFRPVRPRSDGEMDLRGVIHIDPVSYVVRELEFEYLSGRRRTARGTLRYAQVRTPDGVIRLPAGGTISGDPSGMMGAVVQGFEGTYAMEDYRGFERVRDAAATPS